MALGNNSGGGTFLNLSKGKITQKKDGEKLEFDFIEGLLTDIQIKTETFNNDSFEKVTLTLQDGANKYYFGVRLDSSYARAICSTLPNANLNYPIKFQPTFDAEKNRGGMFVSQSGSTLKWAYTKDNPNGLPALKVVRVKGKDVYDTEDQQLFFKDLLLNKIKPQLSHPILAGANTEVRNAPVTSSVSNEEDDLPF